MATHTHPTIPCPICGFGKVDENYKVRESNMKLFPVLNYEQWLNEALEAPVSGSVALCSAYSSETDIGSKLAERMGNLDVTKKYTFTLRDLADVAYLSQALKGAKVEPITDPNKNDILKIGDSVIEETGSILIMKSDFKKDSLVTVSNNGILTLFRLNDCFRDMSELGLPSIKSCSDWAVKLELGKPAKGSNARGYQSWAISPTSIKAIANGMCVGLMILASAASGFPKDRMNMKNTIVKGYYDAYLAPYEESKDFQGAMDNLIKRTGEALKAKNVLVATPTQIDLTNFYNFVKLFSPRVSRLLTTESPTSRTIRLESTERAVIVQVIADVAKTIAVGSSTDLISDKAKKVIYDLGFDDRANSLLVEYTNAIKTGLSNIDPNWGMEFIQETGQFSKRAVKPQIGQQSASSTEYAEGEYGK